MSIFCSQLCFLAEAGARIRDGAQTPAGCDSPEQAQGLYLTQSVFEVVFTKSIPTRIRHLILYISNTKGKFDGFLRELTFARQL